MKKISDKDRARSAHVLMSYYDKLYRDKTSHRPSFNRYSAKWGMMDVVDSVGQERAHELLDYYFTLNSNYSLEFFYKNFDKMDVNERQQRDDRERRARIMKETRDRVEEARD